MDTGPSDDGRDDNRLGKAEVGKDAAQEVLDAAAETMATVTTIVTRAVRDVAKAVGDFATELFEIRDAARRASDPD